MNSFLVWVFMCFSIAQTKQKEKGFYKKSFWEAAVFEKFSKRGYNMEKYVRSPERSF